ncbi:hypothetical protein B5L72_35220 [Pseudomonas aeruginosa]|nr:hypothetical protein CSC31_3434 [Pseudomonas aeruginosa]OPL21864.1 hypothetical protein B5L72_35220 [Pseudomonas aeruginosa]
MKAMPPTLGQSPCFRLVRFVRGQLRSDQIRLSVAQAEQSFSKNLELLSVMFSHSSLPLVK